MHAWTFFENKHPGIQFEIAYAYLGETKRNRLELISDFSYSNFLIGRFGQAERWFYKAARHRLSKSKNDPPSNL